MRRALVTLVVAVAVAAVLFLPSGAVTARGAGDDRHLHPTPTTTPTDDGGDDGAAEMRRRLVENGTIVNGNANRVPPGCSAIRGDREITVRAGRTYAAAGNMFSYDTDRIQVDPCTRVTVTFVNEDSVRHQWMVHGLPRETYAMGMFMLEADGQNRVTGTFVTPAANQTLHVHCSLPQHEQKGMHASLVVGGGGPGGHSHGSGTVGHTHTVATTRVSGDLPAGGVVLAVAGLLCGVGLLRR